MNTRMTVLCALVALGATVSTTPVARASFQQEEERDLAALARQIDIMRLVLSNSISRGFTKVLEDKRPDNDEQASEGDPATTRGMTLQERGSYDAAAAFYVLAQASTAKTKFTSHTRGFYAEGLGVIFSSEVDTPVTKLDVEEGEKHEQDEWDEATQEASGSSSSPFFTLRDNLLQAHGGRGKQTRWEIDSEFVESAITTVLTQLGKHGRRMDALSDDERIIVALRLKPDVSRAYYVGDGDEPSGFLNVYSGYTGAQGARAQHLVIEISKRLLTDDEVSIDTLRRSATITRY